MNLRLTLTSAVAVILASVSIYPLIQAASWFWAGVGAVIAVAIGGIVTRLPTRHAAVSGSVITLVAVFPLLVFPDWGLRIVGALIIAITAASRPRLRLLQALSWVIVYLASLLIYFNLTFAARLSTGGIVPTRASVSYLSTLVSQGLAERIYEPPVPSGAGVVLLAAAGIGLMAVLTDLLAVRLRSPAIAGLPLLALYCVRITTSAKQGGVGATVVFCLALIGYLALLAAEGRERLRIWGRLVTVWHGSSADPAETEVEAPDTRALAASGRRIGLAAACIALAFPLLVPGITVHDLLHTQPTGLGQGGAPIAPPNPLVQMQDQLREASAQTVLTYQTSAKVPSQQYLQVYVLNYNAGNQSWALVQPGGPTTQLGSGHLRPAPGVAASTPQAETFTKIYLSQGNNIGYDARLGFLPLPYAPYQVSAPGGWAEDDATLMVYAPTPQLSGLQYSVISRQAIPDKADESDPATHPAGVGGYLSFSRGQDDNLLKLAEQITAHARTPYQKAEDLQNYFRNGSFTYSLDANLPNGITGLEDFLFQTRTGFCQQFAFAMAGLARLVGIPSRIAVGYTAGSSEHNGTWKVTTADAHAWPELYFSGLGWIRFEPTPDGAGGTATTPQYGAPPGLKAGPAPAPTTQPGFGPGSKSSHENVDRVHNLDLGNAGEAPASRAARGHHGLGPWIPLVVAALVAAALVTPAAARSVVRHRRLQAAGDGKLAHAVWREVRDDLADYGLTGRPSESPRAIAARIAPLLELDPVTTEALGRIVRAEERASYAQAPLPSPTLPADGATVRRALYRQATWPERWRARVLPASMLAPVRAGLQHALDVFGWMEHAGQRFRGRGFGTGTVSSGVRHQE